MKPTTMTIYLMAAALLFFLIYATVEVLRGGDK